MCFVCLGIFLGIVHRDSRQPQRAMIEQGEAAKCGSTGVVRGDCENPRLAAKDMPRRATVWLAFVGASSCLVVTSRRRFHIYREARGT
jgi:hypothetical protein